MMTSSMQAPQLPPNLAILALTSGQLRDDEEYHDGKLDHVILSGQTAHRIHLQRLLFKTVALNQTRLEAAQLRDIRFEDCDLANATWERASGQRIEWLRCQLVGFATPEAHWSHVYLRACQASLARFRFVNFRHARFEKCTFIDADFQGADLTGAQFSHCDLTNVEFSQAKLSGVDLRTSHIDSIKAGPTELSGAIVTPVQAVYLAGRFGLVVKSSGE